MAFCLSASVGLMLNEKQIVLKYTLALSALIQCLSLIITQSRAAWLAIYFVLSILFVRKNKKNLIVFLLLTVIVISGLYYLGPASVHGRLLIWRVCLDMISQRPLFGFGINGFQSNYMLFQANYFARYPDSAFLPYADNISFAYNEFLHIFVNFGFIGTVLFAGVIFLCFKDCAQDESASVLKLSFLSLLCFSLFSYPFSVLRLFIIFLICLLLLERTPSSSLFLKSLLRGSILLVLAGGSTLYIINKYLTKQCQDLFSPDANVALAAKNNIDNRYDRIRLFPDLMDTYAEYCLEKALPQKQRVLLDAAKVTPSCELYTAIGDMMISDEDIESGLAYYITASNMIPLKLLPRYKLFDFYFRSGNQEMALKTGCDILNLPIKVLSSDAIIMLNDIKEKINIFSTLNYAPL